MLSKPIDQFWSANDRARLTRDFVGKVYYDVTVRIKELADNAAVVVDEGGMFRVIMWSDMSFASFHIAQQNPGATVLLKIRHWT